MYCKYYTAHLEKTDVWKVTGALKSFEHLSFDRTMDKENSIFEFFVPAGNEKIFEEIMNYYVAMGIVTDFQERENRLINAPFV